MKERGKGRPRVLEVWMNDAWSEDKKERNKVVQFRASQEGSALLV